MDFSSQIASRSEIAGWLLLYIVPSLLAIFWSRRVLLSGASPARTLLAGTFLLLGVVVIGFVVVSLIYPHGHHDTPWIPSRPRLNYPVDVAIGSIVALAALAAWSYPRSRRPPGSQEGAIG
jgi:hypothetical protein